MKKMILLSICAFAFSINAFAHEAFRLVSSTPKTLTFEELVKLEKERTIGKKDGTTLTFTGKEIRLVITTGPDDDMLSYRIQGVRNPTLIVPPDVTLKVLFVNLDGDMKHDIRFAHIMGEFTSDPGIAMTAGSEKLAPHEDKAPLQAMEMVLESNEDGAYKYFCSVRGHAKGGMWGNILVGVKPGADMKMPSMTHHVHSPDEVQMDDMPGMKKDDKTPVKKPGDMSDMPGMKMDDKKADEKKGDEMANMPGMDHSHHDMKMTSSVNLNDPMSRESSGTAWAPDSSPMHMHGTMLAGGGSLMIHGTAFLRYTSVGSNRDVSVAGKGGGSRVDAPSTLMVVYTKPLNEKSQISLRGHFSLDPIIQRGYGYPLLYQSGETFNGQPIHDRQHPHDLISELGVVYSHKFDDKRSFFLYAGYPGEPALGPPTFVHRLSASNNPDAPISHHWQDSTHITFGVVTGGFSFGKFKIEGSAFKGQEPDDNRYKFDAPRLDSFSGRFSWNPTKNWAFQVSHGRLKNPERGEPELKVQHRTTASAIYNKKIDENRNWASSFVFGNNYGNGESTNAILFESNYDFNKNAVFGRVERVQKSGHELVLPPVIKDQLFWVGSLSLGYVRDIIQNKGIDVGLGSMFTFNTNPPGLTPYYGGTTHGGWQIFMRFRTSKM